METYDKAQIKNPHNFEMEIINATTKRHFYVPKELASQSLSDSDWISLANTKGFIKSFNRKEQAKNHEMRTIKVWKTFRSGNGKVDNLIYKGRKKNEM